MTEHLTLQPYRAPAPERPFRDRDAELQIIENKLDFACRGQPGGLPVTCFWGVAGIGKSWLLIELKRLYERHGPHSDCLSFSTIAARLDLDRSLGSAVWREGKLDRARVVRELWRQLAQQAGADVPDLDHLSPEGQASFFVSQATGWLAHFRPLLLLDTVDDVVREDETAFFWLEEHLVEPLALTNRVLSVFASRGELRRWQRFQVRRRVDLWPLVAFDPLSAGEAVGANAEVSRALYRYTFGHPLANEYLARLLKAAGLDLGTASVQEIEANLKPELVRTALRQTVQHIFAKVPQDLIDLAHAASVLRWVNVEPLQHLTQELRLEPPKDYHDLIGQLQTYHLLYWNLDAGAYQFPSGVGPMLACALEMEYPERFRDAHRAAYAFHREHLEHHPMYLARYVPGAAYHGSVLARAEAPTGSAPAFGDWWQGFLARRAPKDTEPWSELAEALEDDTELREAMPPREHEALYSDVLRFPSRAESSGSVPRTSCRNLANDIRNAIHTGDGSTWIFYIVGEGGVGKTTLLRQIGQDLGSSDGITSSFPWSGILDLYHSDLHSSSGLEARLMKAIERTDEFAAYRRARDEFAARREAGILGQELEEEQSHLLATFADCFNAVTAHHRVAVALDTTERIQYDTDEVQQMCHLDEEATAVKPWLLHQLGCWRNCVVLLAGRSGPAPGIRHDLESLASSQPQIQYGCYEIGGMDLDEMRTYFAQKERQYPEIRELDESFRRRLWSVTGGIPLNLDLAIEVVDSIADLSSFRTHLERLSSEQARDTIQRRLIGRTLTSGSRDEFQALRCLAITRKGLTSELLCDLIADRRCRGQQDSQRCKKLFDALAKHVYVKQRPDHSSLFLHDVMYDLCDGYLLEPSEVRVLSSRVVAWYDEKIDTLGSDKASGKERIRDLKVDSLIYRLRADPQAGYEWYLSQAEYAIRAAELDHDMRLRSELLAFLNSSSRIDRSLLAQVADLKRVVLCDIAAHWVKRYLARGQNEKAIAVAECAFQDVTMVGSADDERFRWARADLSVYHAQALIYVNRTDEAISLLRSTLKELEETQEPETLTERDRLSFTGWRRSLVLGRAHNNLGYAYWMVKGHYGLALEEFRNAQVYFRAADLREEIANTADNMGRVYAALFRRSHAEALVEDGLQLREQLGLDYRVALSRISRAIVHLAFGEPHLAREVVKQALDTCEGLETSRGIGLACLVMGRSLRQLGALWATGVYGYQQSKDWLTLARQHLERAVDIFKNKVTEPVRLIEAYNELGCTYREWAALERRFNPASALARTLVGDAVQHLEESLRLAEQQQSLVQYADACEDLAQTYIARGDYAATQLWLNRAEERIPLPYKITSGRGLQPIPTEECVEEFWQMMGKIELLRGHLAYDQEAGQAQGKVTRTTLEQAMRHYAFAAAYFERFSGQAVRLEATHKQVYNRVKRCRIEDLRYIQDEFLQSLRETYKLDPSALGQFFEETLGLALQLPQ